jgi:AraC-like DNA-binding protein
MNVLKANGNPAAAPMPPSAGDFPDERRTLHEGCAGAVLLISRSAPNAPKQGYAPVSEIALPLAGVFRWKVGRSATTIDANSALFISEGQVFSEAHPIKDRGHAAVVVIPAAAVLDEFCRGRRAEATVNFRAISRVASPRAQLLARRLAHVSDACGSLEGDELTIAFLAETLDHRLPEETPQSCRLVSRAKEFLHEHDGPCSLANAAEEIGVTPIYLTQAFKKSVGLPLYKYQKQLRLSRALNELPNCDSIIDLALDLGFSSHSHFTAAFTATYALTPSAFRESVRSGALAARVA